MSSNKRKQEDPKHPKHNMNKKKKKQKQKQEAGKVEVGANNGAYDEYEKEEEHYDDGYYGGDDFEVDDCTYASAQINACFYPKFDNEKSDQEVRTRMIKLVSEGLATLEVSLKHSGSLFMYAGYDSGAYCKNSLRNIYTAAGIFVLARTFREAWGTKASKKQAEFKKYLETKHMCVSMELVTAVLGDHGQQPHEDYVVVTAVAELGNGKPEFYSTPDIIAFCRKWRLPTNHVWLFSTKKSVTSFFAAYDALYEEGTATPVCKVLDEVANISVPGSKDHVKVQGEILEGFVARIVSRESSKYLEKILKDFPPPKSKGGHDMGPTLREMFSADMSFTRQCRALLQSVGTSLCPDYSDWDNGYAQSGNSNHTLVSKFLDARPADYCTTKLKEIVHLVKEKRLNAAFKCYSDFHKKSSMASDNLHFKMVIHVYSDSAFLQYQKEMKKNPGLWPLYRGFFVDVSLYKATKERAAEIEKDSNIILNDVRDHSGKAKSRTDGLTGEDANLMIKLKFLTYKLRTFLIRNGLPTLFEGGPEAYREYYLRQMRKWNTSALKQRELSKMLDEWADYVQEKCWDQQLHSSVYLSEAEPFLEQYANRSPVNQALIGSAGNVIRTGNFMLNTEGGWDEHRDLNEEISVAPSSPSRTETHAFPKHDGLIVFFPGIPGCGKSVLCDEILSCPAGLGDDRPVDRLMGDLVKGKYWTKVADGRKRNPYSVTLADKNAPNEEVWSAIENMCLTTRASAVPVVPDSEGSASNPYSLDALAVFIFRVLQRVNHPGKLDKASPVVGYVLLMFYHLYEGMDREEFESDLAERFGSIVKMPLLEAERKPLPSPLKSVLEEGISLYNRHTAKHGRLESTRGSYSKEWADWEKRLRNIFSENAKYLKDIQVPFDFSVKEVLEQLSAVAKGDYVPPSTKRRKYRNIVFSAITVPVTEIIELLSTLAQESREVKAFLKGKDMQNCLKHAHLTLAHRGTHGLSAVVSYGEYLHQDVPICLTALLFSDDVAAMEAILGEVDGQKIVPKANWPHVTIWTGKRVLPKVANTLPQLLEESKATRIDIDPPVHVSGTVDFY